MNILKIIFAGVILGGAVSPAMAQVTIYTSQSDFDAAVISETSFGFDEGNSTDHYHVLPNPYTQSGITFTDNVTAADGVDNGIPILFLIGAAATPNYGQDFLSFQNTDVGITADITMSGVTAFGFDYATYIADGAATVAVNGSVPSVIAVTGTPSFIGFTSTTPITDVSIVFPTAYSFDLTKVFVGAATASVTGAVPEPASWAMMIVGFGVVGGAMRRGKTRTGAAYA